MASPVPVRLLSRLSLLLRRLDLTRALHGRAGAVRGGMVLATAGVLATVGLMPGERRHAVGMFGADTVVVYGPRQLAGSGGNGTTYVERFTATVVPGQAYTLRIDNGTANGSNRSAKVTVLLNGFQVVAANEVTQQIARLDKVVALTAVDTLRITVGTAGSQVTVHVLGTPDRFYDVFGPRTFTKSTSSGIDSTVRFSSGVTGIGSLAGRLYVVNGASDGTHRITGGSVTVNGQSFSLGAAVGSLSGGVTVNRQPTCVNPPCLLANTVRVNVTGPATSFLTLRVQIPDSTKPVLTIATPAPNAVTNQTSVAVTGTVQDQTAVTVTVNGTAASLAGTAYSATVPLATEGSNLLTVIARDVSGLHTDSTRTVLRDTQAPSFTLSAPTDGLITQAHSVTVSGTLANPAGTTMDVNGVPLVVQGNGAFAGQAPLTEGVNVLTVTARDAATNSLSLARTVTRDSTPPALTVTAPGDGTTTNQASVAVTGTVTDATALTLTINGVATVVGAGGAFEGTVQLAEGPNTLTLLATDAAGNTATVVRTVTRNGATLPPDPVTVAPPLDRSVVTTIADATEFLYTGTNPIQVGVSPATIDTARAAVLRGRVLDRAGQPLGGATISILAHPEFGHTLSRADGAFDLVVNGGAALSVNYVKAGYLGSQRQVEVPWQDFAPLPDVVLVALDPMVAAIDFSDPIEVARGSVSSDSSGTRRATVLFPQGTTATMTLPNGSTQPLSTLHVRATEYTVGPNGPQAMPGDLPAASAYTYAVELSADEAVSAGATAVHFSKPAVLYVENFLGFPVGSLVPVGYYDPAKAQWVPSANGRVVKVVGISAGKADLDASGSGAASGQITLDSLGVTDAERIQVAALYAVGQTLWRSRHTHFTATDINWPFGYSKRAIQPPLRKPWDPNVPCPNKKASSIVECETQVLGERIGVTGTAYTLNYRSSRFRGDSVDGTRVIELSPKPLPDAVRIDLEIRVAGQLIKRSFPPVQGQKFAFTWDGRDAYGRRMQGAQPMTVRVGYAYDFVSYLATGVSEIDLYFGRVSGSQFLIRPRRIGEQMMWSEQHLTIGGMDAEFHGLGGWTLSAHHTYDPIAHVLYTGDGGRRGTDEITRVIRTIAGNTGGVEQWGYGGDGGPATEALFYWPEAMKVAPDGTIYIADTENHRVRRIGLDGIIRTVAGNGDSDPDNMPGAGDGGPATEAIVPAPIGLALGHDGSLYIAEWDGVVRKVDSSGIISTVAGRRDWDGVTNGDGGLATQAGMYAVDVAVGQDNSLYILDDDCRIRQVTPDGIIHSLAGNSTCASSGDGGPAAQAQIQPFYRGLAVGPDGSVYFVDEITAIRQITPDGIITTIAGASDYDDSGPGDGGPAAAARFSCITGLAAEADGGILISDQCTLRVRRIAPDGIITTVAGDGTYGWSGDGGPATAARFKNLMDVAVAPDGSILASDDVIGSVREIRSQFPGMDGRNIFVASSDGSELYEFTYAGRHLRTLDALTGATLLSFTYNPDGLLLSLVGPNGNTTTIQRSPSGAPLSITGPFGQRTDLTVDAQTHLATIVNPAGEVVRLVHSSAGLLDSLVDPRGMVHRFEYDDMGRLRRDENPASGFLALARSETDSGHTVTLTSALGRVTGYTYVQSAKGDRRRTTTDAAGLSTTSLVGANGTAQTTLPDGTIVTSTEGGDPRWGMQSPFASLTSIRAPSGLTFSLRRASQAVLTDPTNALSLQSLTDTVSLNGKASVTVYSASQRTFTSTSPRGRQVVTRIDSLGRPVSSRNLGLDSVTYSYDTRGRVSTVATGGRSWTYGYDIRGRLLSTLDPVGRRDSLFYDTADRLTRHVLPGGREVQYAYDSSGNLSSVTPPGRPAHAFTYTAVDQTGAYTPPTAGLATAATSYTYNSDRQLTQITRPDGLTVGFGYEPTTGRPSTVTFDRGQLSYGYLPSTGLRSGITAPGGLTLAYTYDGSLPKTVTWGGAISGSVGVSYNTDFQITAQTVNGANSLALGYDTDGLLTVAGTLGIKRHAQHGMVERDSVSNLLSVMGYDPKGALSSIVASLSGTPVFQTGYLRDSLSRITELTESVAGVPSPVLTFAYDSAGRLFEVRRGGVLSATYEYDANGNRTRLTTPGGVVTAAYDDQDRLSSYGTTTYTYGSNGELKTKTEPGLGTTNYTYDALGNLVAASLPDGTALTYLIDGENRRIGKKVNGTLVQGLLYQNQLAPVAELNGNNDVVSRFVYGARANVPDYMVKGGVTYRLISDHLGSVRLVVNAATGAVAQRLDYDEYGRLTQNTAPGFQPFGYAGGLIDSHTGLIRFGARDYDPTSGRWTAKDPLRFAGGSNLYGYALDDPVNVSDPFGLDPLSDCMKRVLSPYFPAIDLNQVDLQRGIPDIVHWGAREFGGIVPAGFTWDNTIYVDGTIYDRSSTLAQTGLVGHELQHVTQFYLLGTGYMSVLYAADWILNRYENSVLEDAADRVEERILDDLRKRYPNGDICKDDCAK